MKVKVVGCSTAWTDRPVSCYCLDDNILIDCGEGVTKYFNKCGVDFYSINKIFITHFHSDHIFAVVQFMCQHCIYNDESKKKSLTIYGPKGSKKHLDLLKYFAFGEEESKTIDLEEYINIVEIDNENEIIIDGYNVKPYKLKHGEMVNFAYTFEKDGKTVGFSGDCTYDNNVEKFTSSCDLCFLECCAEKTTSNHLGYDKFYEIKNRYKNCRFLAVHCVDRIYKNQDQFDIEFAKDGESVEI